MYKKSYHYPQSNITPQKSISPFLKCMCPFLYFNRPHKNLYVHFNKVSVSTKIYITISIKYMTIFTINMIIQKIISLHNYLYRSTEIYIVPQKLIWLHKNLYRCTKFNMAVQKFKSFHRNLCRSTKIYMTVQKFIWSYKNLYHHTKKVNDPTTF